MATLLVIVLLIAGAGTGTLWMRAAARAPHRLYLADGTAVFFRGHTPVEPAGTYPQAREIHVDGDAFFRAPAASAPLVVRTRLLVLTVTGASAFRVTAYAKDSGEQVEVLYGRVQANKSYASSYNIPDMLTGGEMSMINQTIDLMEKERFDPAELRKWSDELVASAERRQVPPAQKRMPVSPAP